MSAVIADVKSVILTTRGILLHVEDSYGRMSQLSMVTITCHLMWTIDIKLCSTRDGERLPWNDFGLLNVVMECIRRSM